MLHTLTCTGQASCTVTAELDAITVHETILHAITATDVTKAFTEVTRGHFIGRIRSLLSILLLSRRPARSSLVVSH